MKILNFLPQWYKKKTCNAQMKRVMLLSTILLLVNLILFWLDLRAFSSLRYTNLNIKTNMTKSVSSSIEKKRTIRNSRFIDDFKQILLLKKGNIEYSSVEINETNIIISAIAETVEDYIGYVNMVESESNFRIKDISSPINSDNKIKFTVILSKK